MGIIRGLIRWNTIRNEIYNIYITAAGFELKIGWPLGFCSTCILCMVGCSGHKLTFLTRHGSPTHREDSQSDRLLHDAPWRETPLVGFSTRRWKGTEQFASHYSRVANHCHRSHVNQVSNHNHVQCWRTSHPDLEEWWNMILIIPRDWCLRIASIEIYCSRTIIFYIG